MTFSSFRAAMSIAKRYRGLKCPMGRGRFSPQRAVTTK